MKIVIVGASGAVGNAALKALSARHDVVTVGKSSGDIRMDMEDVDSIRSMYKQVGKIDAMICAAGQGHFGPVDSMTNTEFMTGLNRKTIPQINLVLEGFDSLNDNGSFTLTSGVLNRDPISGGACAAAANGAIDGFVVGAAVDMPRGIRINVVSPEILEASREKYSGFFPGHNHVTDEAVGRAYCKSVEGCLSGQLFIVE